MKFKNATKYILIRHETIIRTEKIRYEINIPEDIIDKKEYAEEMVSSGDYINSKVVDVLGGQVVNEENLSLRKKQ